MFAGCNSIKPRTSEPFGRANTPPHSGHTDCSESVDSALVVSSLSSSEKVSYLLSRWGQWPRRLLRRLEDERRLVKDDTDGARSSPVRQLSA